MASATFRCVALRCAVLYSAFKFLIIPSSDQVKDFFAIILGSLPTLHCIMILNSVSFPSALIICFIAASQSVISISFTGTSPSRVIAQVFNSSWGGLKRTTRNAQRVFATL